jgi:hypothetical protein
MSPPRFFEFSRLEPCLQVGSLGFRGTANLHRREEGHLFEWRALQTTNSCQQGSGHSKLHRITAGGSAALGWSKIRVAVLCLQSTRSLVRHVHRVKGSGVSPSHLSTLLLNRIGHWSLNLHPSFNDNFVDIQPSRGEQRLLATSINLAARRSLLRCAICLPILDAARWWTRMRMTISRIKICLETIDGHMPCTQEGQWSCQFGDSQGAPRFLGQ